MTITRVSLDAVAWPLWGIAIAHLIIACVSLVTFIEYQQMKYEMQKSFHEAEHQMQKAAKAFR